MKSSNFRLQIYVPKEGKEDLISMDCVQESENYHVLTLDMPSQHMRAAISQYISMCLAVPKFVMVTYNSTRVRSEDNKEFVKKPSMSFMIKTPPAWLSDSIKRVIVTGTDGYAFNFYCYLNDDLDILSYMLNIALSKKEYSIRQEQRYDSSTPWVSREIGTFYRKSIVDQLASMPADDLENLLKIGQEYQGHLDKLLKLGRAHVLNKLGFGL